MKNVSKFCLGLITVFSLTACGKGTKVTREKFFEEAGKINSNNLKKAKLTYKRTTKVQSGRDILEEEKESFSGLFLKDESGNWVDGSDKNDNDAKIIFNEVYTYFYLDGTVNTINHFEVDDNEHATKKYYIKPFSFNYHLEEKEIDYGEYDYDVIYDRCSMGDSRAFFTEPEPPQIIRTKDYNFEWNDQGYVTSIVNKTETKIGHRGYSSVTNVECNIVYR